MDGSHSDTRMVDLEVEEADDVSGDPSIGPDSPTSLHRMSKSQTKTWVVKSTYNFHTIRIRLNWNNVFQSFGFHGKESYF